MQYGYPSVAIDQQVDQQARTAPQAQYSRKDRISEIVVNLSQRGVSEHEIVAHLTSRGQNVDRVLALLQERNARDVATTTATIVPQPQKAYQQSVIATNISAEASTTYSSEEPLEQSTSSASTVTLESPATAGSTTEGKETKAVPTDSLKQNSDRQQGTELASERRFRAAIMSSLKQVGLSADIMKGLEASTPFEPSIEVESAPASFTALQHELQQLKELLDDSPQKNKNQILEILSRIKQVSVSLEGENINNELANKEVLDRSALNAETSEQEEQIELEVNDSPSIVVTLEPTELLLQAGYTIEECVALAPIVAKVLHPETERTKDAQLSNEHQMLLDSLLENLPQDLETLDELLAPYALSEDERLYIQKQVETARRKQYIKHNVIQLLTSDQVVGVDVRVELVQLLSEVEGIAETDGVPSEQIAPERLQNRESDNDMQSRFKQRLNRQ